jgi:anthranilate phosphoribosyltransferase
MIVELIRKLARREDLTRAEAHAAVVAIMEGQATDAQISAFITALRMKGETVDEITGCALAMREKSARINAGASKYDIVDTCGTGGDVSNTFNISTAAALVVAGAGVKVAKHGNRSVSSKSGSADVLKALGVNIEANAATVERCIEKTNIGFLFAPMLHPAMKYAIGPRREIGIRTVFNILGPLTNPAGARCQVLGVYDAAMAQTMAGVLRELGSKRCFVVHGSDGLDEITTADSTQIAELANGKVSVYQIAPEDFSLPRCKLADLVVDSPEASAAAIRDIMAGKKGPRRDIVLLNASAGLAAAGAASDLQSGIALAADAIDSGRAADVLHHLVEESTRNQ